MSDFGDSKIRLGQLGLGSIHDPTITTSKYAVYVPQPESAVVAPSEMIALGDAFAESKGKLYRNISEGLGFNLVAVGYVMDGSDPEKLARMRHTSRANIAFCDGHVEGLPFKRLFGEADESMRRWNVDNNPHRERRVRN